MLVLLKIAQLIFAPKNEMGILSTSSHASLVRSDDGETDGSCASSEGMSEGAADGNAKLVSVEGMNDGYCDNASEGNADGAGVFDDIAGSRDESPPLHFLQVAAQTLEAS